MENQHTDAVKELFTAWITNPSEIRNEDSGDIELLIQKYPFCQILQAFGAKASQQESWETPNKELFKASIYSPNRTILFQLLRHPEKLTSLEIEPEYEVIENGNTLAYLISDEIVLETKQKFEVAENLYIDEPEYLYTEDEEQKIALDEESIEDEAENEKHVLANLREVEAKNEEEKMILENISTTDFFAFENKLDVLAGEHSKHPDVPSQIQHDLNDSSRILNQTPENQEISRYDDDQMPFSFLWWLHKTRKEHADTYQPYVEFKLDTSRQIKNEPAKELNHQIIENIFHLQSPLDELQDKQLPLTVHFEVKRKEEEIIEKFIREEPQIHAPSPDKLDMENKARKSAEDPNDLVSETLAFIYTEQMLFHKAIDTYKKLSLKFPEKRAYFADQISELEKKIN